MNHQEEINRRKQLLIQLHHTIQKYEAAVISALQDDFKKPTVESFLSEIHIVYDELKTAIKNLKSWTTPKRVWPNLLNFPSSDWIYQEPYGYVLIISPWNYPFQLAICPLIGAVAAGNKVTLKPSELTPKTSEVIQKLVNEVFSTNEVTVVLGGKEAAEELLEQKWDYIFFTGSTRVGQIVAQAAAKNLTPITLELGGKNPCIVDASAQIPLAAKRIIWGKLFNAGQTCIAPDYLLVHRSVKTKLIDHLILEIQNALGENSQQSPDFARIINLANWERLTRLLNDQKIIYGGNSQQEEKYLSLTIVDEPSLDSPLMQDEIFGPILPILSFETETDLQAVITRYDKPLSLYVFSKNTDFCQKMISHYSFGGGCINDTMVYFANHRLPFGGIGASGMGAYHGKYSFTTFSHAKPILKKANWLDIPLRYAPYKNKFNLLKKLLHWL